ncbi:MAG: M48 family metallopeptidase [Bacteroidota bacterium]|nr:M48 family metallopeptidase [Bacteroidota bacterium]
MHQIIFYLIIAFLLFDYVLDQTLDFLNSTKRNSKLPEKLKGIYSEEKYAKSQKYDKINQRFGFITSTFNLVLILAFLFFQGFAFVDNIARNISDNPIIISLVFFGILMFAFDIINTPFSIYQTFVIEEKFGFNKTTAKIFILDKIKGWIISIIIGGGILALITWFYQLTANMFWIYTWILVSVFMIFMTMFYTSIIVPLFNKLKPLEEGELKESIFDFCNKVDYTLENVYIINGSKRSTKANAYFSGLGKKKKIVLFDTLLEKLKVNEITAVLAHEIGHYKLKHTLVNIILSLLQTGITLFILSLLVGNPALSKALGAEQTGFHLGLIAFSLLYSPISTILGLGMNIFSRKNEYQADNFAGKYLNTNFLIEALKKLSINNLSNLTPHPLYVFFNYSHPPLLNRIEALENINK